MSIPAIDRPKAPESSLKKAEAFAGAGFGLFVGLLLGLSVSPVVGTVIGPIAALLGAILGLTGRSNPAKAIRLGAFGVACAAGVVCGIAIRSQSLLSPSIKDSVARWAGAGYPPDEARAYVALERLGVQPPSRTVKAAPTPPNAMFATTDSATCARLEAAGTRNVADVLGGLGGPYRTIGALLRQLPEDAAPKATEDVVRSLCG